MKGSYMVKEKGLKVFGFCHQVVIDDPGGAGKMVVQYRNAFGGVGIEYRLASG